MKHIEHFNLPEQTNELYKKEAISSISLSREIAKKINELVDTYNSLSQIDLEWKQQQEGTIRKSVIYIKDNLINTLHDLVEILENDGFFKSTIQRYTTDLEKQIDNLLRSVTVDGELIDVRYGADGSIYDTAGNAVRGQFNSILKSIDYLKNPLEQIFLSYTTDRPNNLINKTQLEPGFYVGTDGIKRASDDFTLSNQIDVSGLTEIYFNSSGVGLSCFYTIDGQFISYLQNAVDPIAVPENAKYLLCSIGNEHINRAFVSRYPRQKYDDGVIAYGKKPYQSGFVSFTIPVIQTVADNNADASDYSEKLIETLDVNCVLSMPTSYTPYGTPSKLLMMCHGAGQGVDTWKDNQGYKDIVQRFNESGYLVFDCNGFKNDALGWSFWGNQRGLEAWRKAYQYIVDNYNVEKDFSIYAFSMGGLTALNLAFQSFPNIKCIAMGSPVVNLRACFDDPSVKEVLKLLYGMGDEWDASKAFGNDPYKHIIDFNGSKYCFPKLPPIKIWYGSTEESYGVNKQYAIDLVNAINNAGGYAQYREVQGAGHEICYGMNGYCNYDYVAFIDRYNTEV